MRRWREREGEGRRERRERSRGAQGWSAEWETGLKGMACAASELNLLLRSGVEAGLRGVALGEV